MGDRHDGGQRRAVRVVDHDCAGVGVEPLTQPGRIPGQREGSDRSWGDDATPVDQLASGRAPPPDTDDGQPLDEFAAPDADPGQGTATADDRAANPKTRTPPP